MSVDDQAFDEVLLDARRHGVAHVCTHGEKRGEQQREVASPRRRGRLLRRVLQLFLSI